MAPEVASGTRSEDSLRAAFVSALPGIAGSASAAPLNDTFCQFVAGNPSLAELKESCEQYLEYACETPGPSGLEAPCGEFLSYLQQLRGVSEAEPDAAQPLPTGGPPVLILLHSVQWHAACDAADTVARLTAQAVTSLELRGAPLDAQDSDSVSVEAARALAVGLVGCRSTLASLSLQDLKLSMEGLRAVLQALAGSPALRRLELSNLCSRWTVSNTLGEERGSLLSELLRGWPRLESLRLPDCALAAGCVLVAGALLELGELREVDLTYNEMDDAAAVVLAQSLVGKPHLVLLAVGGNGIGTECLVALKATLK